MCPLRLILVFFSAVMAGYFAWRTVGHSQQQSELIEEASGQYNPSHSKRTSASRKMQEFGSLKMMQNCFWVFIDMASGRYLWRNLKGMREAHGKTQKLAS